MCGEGWEEWGGGGVCGLQMALSDRHWAASPVGPQDEVISTPLPPRKRAGPGANRRIRSQEMGPGHTASLDPAAENIAQAQAEGGDSVENSTG